MKNYSQTYAASLVTFAPIVVMILGKFGVNILETDFVTIAGSIISAVGFIWQLVHRYNQGGVKITGGRK